MKKLTYLFLFTLFSLFHLSAFSQTDTEPPKPVSFSFSPGTINTTNEDQEVSVSLRVTDDVTGVKYAHIYWLDPSGGNTIHTAWTMGPPSTDTTFVGKTVFPKNSVAGDWKIDRIALKDEVNDWKYYYTEELKSMGISANLHVISESDTEAPKPVSFTYNKDTINTTSTDQSVAISLRVSDDLSGVRNAHVYWADPAGNNNVHTSWMLDPTSVDTTLTGTTIFPRNSPAGDWKIHRIALKDPVSEWKYYYTDELKTMGISANLHVISITDNTPPKPVSLHISPDTINTSNGDQSITMSLRVSDDLSGITNVQLYWLDPLGNTNKNSSWYLNSHPNDTTFTETVVFTKGAPEGDWQIDRIAVKDQIGDWKYYYTNDLKELGITAKLVNSSSADPNPIGVSTRAASQINKSSAKLNGFVCLNGGSHKLYFGYGEGDVINQEVEVGVNISGVYNSHFNTAKELTNLMPNTKYSFQLISKDFSGNVQESGNILSFTTTNNRAPAIKDSTYHANEGLAVKSEFASLLASDADGDPLSYQILSGNEDATFSVSSEGKLVLEKTLDFEIKDQYLLSIAASDGFDSNSASIAIKVIDKNETPVVNDSIFNVAENTSISSEIGKLNASDPENNTLTYSISSGNNDGIFSINVEGKLKLEKNVDFESTSKHTLQVNVSDGEFTDDATVLVKISDINEAPQLPDTSFEVKENAIAATEVGSIVASDPENDALNYSITSGNDDGIFSITTDGKLILEKKLDYEGTTQYSLTVSVSDGELNDNATVAVNVTNINETPVANDTNFEIKEDAALKSEIGSISASDPENDQLSYSISSGNDDGIFSINSNGKLILEKKLDFESTDQHSLTVNVSDGELSTNATVVIQVTNVNEAPQLSDTSFEVKEDAVISTKIGSIIASDPENDALHYSITSGNDGDLFSITSEGKLILEKTLDYEDISNYILSIVVSDGSLSNSGDITINVININDEVPVNILFNNSDDSSISIGELQSVGQIQIALSTEDPDSDSFTYSLIDGEGSEDNESFEITNSSLTNKIVLDHLDKVFKIRVQSSDGLYNIQESFEIKVQVVTTAIDDIQAVITKVYPNPCSDILHLKLSKGKLSELNKIQIIGLDGRVYKTENTRSGKNETVQMNVSNLPAGTYILRCIYKKGMDTIKFNKH